MVDFDTTNAQSYAELVSMTGGDKPVIESFVNANIPSFTSPVLSIRSTLNIKLLPEMHRSFMLTDGFEGQQANGVTPLDTSSLMFKPTTFIERFTSSFRLASLDIPVGSKHFSSDADEIGYNERNIGAGATVEVGEDNGWSFTALIYQDSLKGVDEEKQHNPDSDNWSPVLLANYFFGITNNFKCGVSAGITDYDGEMPRAEFYKTISPIGFTSCVLDLTEKFSVQVGYAPAMSVNGLTQEEINEAGPDGIINRDPPHVLVGLIKINLD